MLSVFDHGFVFLFAIVYPVVSTYLHFKYLDDLRAGKIDLTLEYLRTSGIQWILLIIGLAIWVTAERSWPDLGLGFEAGLGFWIAAAFTAAGTAALVNQIAVTRKYSTEARREALESLGDLKHFLPRTPKHLRAFNLLSVTAGIVEEILWRGFLIWYLSFLMPVWGAAILSSALFGMGHMYQGPAGVVKTAALGGMFAGLYLGSGSLWVPIVAHILLDVLQGMLVSEYFKTDEDSDVPKDAAVA